MISVIVTAYKEEKTIAKAVKALASDLSKNDELIVIAPDKETRNVVLAMKKNFPQVRTLKDLGDGKPAALNQAVKIAKGEILALTDGDVEVTPGSIKRLVKPLISNKKIGASTGNPVSINSRSTKLGFWSFLLTNTANERRKIAVKTNRRFFCSGYFFAIRKDLFPKIPKDLLSEDGYISHNVYTKGYKIAYVEDAKVLVKFPTNFSDWIIQKKRSAGGYNQIKKIIGVEIRSFRKESLGALKLIKYVKRLREFYWLISLYFARIYLWALIYRDVNFKKLKREEIWLRVESTK